MFFPRPSLLGFPACVLCLSAPGCASPPRTEGARPAIARMEVVKEGLAWGEGPCRLDDGRCVFADIPAHRVWAWSPAGVALWRTSEGLANGHALAPDGTVLACEEGARRIVRTDARGNLLAIVREKDDAGHRFNSPNDLCLGPDGRIWFSDPTFGIRQHPEWREQPFPAVWSCRQDGADLRRETGMELGMPNGLAFTPGFRSLLAVDCRAGRVLEYPLDPAGRLGAPRTFCACDGADGLRVDARGRVYTAESSGIVVRRPDGTELARLPVPGGATNLCFVDDVPTALLVTCPNSCRLMRLKWE